MLFGVLFCVFLNSEIYAQSDGDKQIQENEIISSGYEGIENPDIYQMEYLSRLKKKQAENTVAKSASNNQSGELEEDKKKEPKKEEISTLSFNLFLYVIDRFKED